MASDSNPSGSDLEAGTPDSSSGSEAERFLGVSTSKVTALSEVSFKQRFWTVSISWGVALVASGSIAFFGVFFPFGLWAILHVEPSNNEIGAAFLGWMIYIPLTIVVMLQKKRRLFYIFYGLLLGLLILNVAGCHMIANDLGGIH